MTATWLRGNQSRLEMAALIAILLLAAVLRLGSPGVIEFKRDEANLSQLALDIVRGRSFPLLGISSSVGVPNPPISVYIFSIPYLFTSNPTFATQFVGFLNVFAVLLTYLLARRYYGAGAALTAALLYAVSPWAIIYSRKIWAQDLLPPFVLLTMLTGLIGFIDGKRWVQWLCLPLLSITAQIHYSALVLVAPVAYLIWRGRPNWSRAFALSFIPAVLFVLPFILGILAADLPTMDELTTLATSGASGGEGRTIGFTGVMLHYAALTIAGTEIHSLAGSEAFQAYLASVSDAYPLFGLLAWAALISALWLLVRIVWRRDSRTRIDGLLLLWLLSPIAVFSITWTVLYPHYLIVMMPVAFIILAAGLGDLWVFLRSRLILRRILFAGVGSLLAVILVLQIALWFALVDFLLSHDTPGGFGTPLEYILPVRDTILKQQPSQVIAHLDGQFVGTNDDTTVWDFLLYDVPDVRFVDDNTRVYPGEDALLLSSRCVEGMDEYQFPLRTPEEGCYQLTERPTVSVLFGIEMPTLDATFANGVHVDGYSWSTPVSACLDLVWSITARTDQDYMFSIHFFDAERQEIVNADGLSWRGVYWRVGDKVSRRFCLSVEGAALADQIAGVNVGMYTYDGSDFFNVDVLDVQGNPIGQIVSIQFP